MASPLALSQALNVTLVALLAVLFVSKNTNYLGTSLARSRAPTAMSGMMSPLGNLRMVSSPSSPALFRSSQPMQTFEFGFPELTGFQERDVSCDAVPKKRHSKQKKRHRKTLWKKKALKNAEKALVIARKIRNQADDDE
mmetsp:Transcript_4145/g.5533  ORF Transcript_4145/g.5533 Transcript_4145/m.5533 type:complete len:139 (-) Transcript_4145:127-543(-)|eukprot:CAMPEP_0185257438 /NCGR_PEP_ID=MMETSP1359-20130426/6503_1 /TAXON_ID=552665 /ORGANISM="Bigelowiella longifila, Strain CCMP242" /LENGTH=138 /DNA_ID=CAMNT_0027842527 /DNA_START=46 /DNA_END=462 /DNA_ORIENTATION=-